jgi:hypothetical protein
MRRIPAKYGHYVFGVIQSGITSGVAAAIASVPFLEAGSFLINWVGAWLLSWTLMLPIVIFAAPFIRKAVNRLTDEAHAA